MMISSLTFSLASISLILSLIYTFFYFLFFFLFLFFFTFYSPTLQSLSASSSYSSPFELYHMIRFFSHTHTHTHFYTKNKNGYCSIPEFLFTSYSAVQVSTASTTGARHRFVVCYFFFSPASSSLRLFCCIRLAVRRMCRVCDCLLLLLLRLTR